MKALVVGTEGERGLDISKLRGQSGLVTLDNGLKVLVQEEHTAPLVSVWCW